MDINFLYSLSLSHHDLSYEDKLLIGDYIPISLGELKRLALIAAYMDNYLSFPQR